MQLSLEKAFLGKSVLSWIPFLGCLRACVQAFPPVQASFEVERMLEASNFRYAWYGLATGQARRICIDACLSDPAMPFLRYVITYLNSCFSTRSLFGTLILGHHIRPVPQFERCESLPGC